MQGEQQAGSGREKLSAEIAVHRAPSVGSAVWQTVNSLGPYLALWGLMAYTVTISWWLTLPLAALAGGFLIRTFIIFHDCGHGSFFASRRLNDRLGAFLGLLSFTPYRHWRGQHAIHHGTTGNLDKRGTGDVWTMTVREYLEAPRRQRIAYRLMRNPVVLLVVAPLFLLVVQQRFAGRNCTQRERRSVWWTNAAIVALVAGMCWLIGPLEFLVIQAVVLAIAGGIGIWLFYLQHQFEGTYWECGEEWDFLTAALHGSSYLQLPRVLQWFTGNIGFHHVHHLDARIPNYRLQACHQSLPELEQIKPLTLLDSVGALWLALWDETSRKLVRFRAARRSAA